MKEAGPVTPCHFTEVGQRRGECPRSRLLPGEGTQEAAETALYGSPRQGWLVGEYLRDAMHPGVSDTHVGPEGRGRG